MIRAVPTARAATLVAPGRLEVREYPLPEAPAPGAVAEGLSADLVVDATGFPGSFAQAVAMVRDGGTVIEVGAFVDMGEERLNPPVLCARDLTLFGVAGEDLVTYENTLALLARHRHAIPFAELVSHRFGVAEAAEAMAVALDPEASAKVLISPATGAL